MSSALASKTRPTAPGDPGAEAPPDEAGSLPREGTGPDPRCPDPVVGFGVGHVLADRYRLEALLGRGGFGGVYRAQDLRLDVPVAIKLIPGAPTVELHVLESLEQEARLVIRMNHPNIVRFFNFERVDGASFIVMEHLPGENLHRFRRRVGTLSEREVAYVAVRCLAALEYAHSHRVVHRDVKPSNILLAPGPGSSMVVKMVDFGIARRLADDLSEGDPATSSGTPVYMAPEQLRGNFDHRTDLYALGVTLYELLSGRPPFHRGGLESVVWQILNEAPPVLSGVSPGFAEVLDRALAKDPDDRFQDAAEFRAALEAMEGMPSPVPERSFGPATAVDAPPVLWIDDPTTSAGGLRVRTSVAVEDIVIDGGFRSKEPWAEEDLRREAEEPAGPWATLLACILVFALGFGLTTIAPALLSHLQGRMAEPSTSIAGAVGGGLPSAALPADGPAKDMEPALEVPQTAGVGPGGPIPPVDAERGAGDAQELRVVALLEQGDAAMREGRVSESLALHRRVLELDPGNERARTSLDALGARFLRLGDEAVREGTLGSARTHYERAAKVTPTGGVMARLAALDDATEILDLERRGRIDIARMRWRNLLERNVEGPIEVLGARGLARLGPGAGAAPQPSSTRYTPSPPMGLRATFAEIERRSTRASLAGEIELWRTFLARFEDRSGPEIEEARARLGELRIKRQRLAEGL